MLCFYDHMAECDNDNAQQNVYIQQYLHMNVYYMAVQLIMHRFDNNKPVDGL